MVFRLAIGVVATVLAVVLAVGWQILVVSDLGSVARGFTPANWWFLILGSIFFGLVILGLVLLCAWLIREMGHTQRQQAFLDAVTHEMRTPLASLRLALDTLRRRDPDLTENDARLMAHATFGLLNSTSHSVKPGITKAAEASSRTVLRAMTVAGLASAVRLGE